MTFTLRHRAQAILREAGWEIAPPPVIWSPRMARCAGLFVIEKDSRGKWHPEIRLSIPLLRRRDWPWPQPVCGMNCHDPEQVQQRILEHELIHFNFGQSRTALESISSAAPERARTVLVTGATSRPNLLEELHQ